MPEQVIDVAIFDKKDPTKLLAYLENRVDPKCLEEIKGVGGGSFSISLDDPKLIETPDLLDHRNVVKFLVDGRAVGGFIISKKKPTVTESGEYSDRMIEVSGEGLLAWFRDAAIYPMAGLTRDMVGNDRWFNFATIQGNWYSSSDWSTPVKVLKKGTVNHPWTPYPMEWPEAANHAWWVWSTANGWSTGAALGMNYFRYEFTLPTSGKYQFVTAADDFYSVYLDGQSIDGDNVIDRGYTTTHSFEVDLDAGKHVFGAKVTNIMRHAGLIAGILKIEDTTDGTKPVSVISVTGDPGWQVATYGKSPGWSIGDVLLQTLNEAQSRGVLFPTWLTPTFSSTTDTYGNSWPRDLEWSVKVGDPILSLIEKMQEFHCDVWIDSDTLELNAALKRGTTRPNVVFTSGKNLLSHVEDERGEIVNALLAQSNDGWLLTEDASSTSKYGRIEGYASFDFDGKNTKTLADLTVAQQSTPATAATYDVFPADGDVPYADFFVGDTVTADAGTSDQVARRVMSIALSEGKSGNISYGIEFDNIVLSREERLKRRLDAITRGTLGGKSGNAQPGGKGRILLPASAPTYVDPPVTATASSTGYWTDTGIARSQVRVDWTTIASNAGMASPDNVTYEVWGRDVSGGSSLNYGKSSGLTMTIADLPAGRTMVFSVRAVTNGGYASSFVDTPQVITAKPLDKLDPPTQPSAASELGIVTVTWNGKLRKNNTDVDPPLHLSSVYVEYSTSSSGTYTKVGSPLTPGSPQTVLTGLAIGTTYWFRLVAVDVLGGKSTPSSSVSTVVKGIEKEKIEQATLDQIYSAASAQAGQNVDSKISQIPTVTYSTSGPPSTGTYNAGSTWFQRDTSGNVTGQWEYKGGSWSPVVMSHQVIASVDLGKATVGKLNGQLIDANTILAGKLAADAVDANNIKAGAVTAGALSATAINGMTITGAVIRTAASGARTELGPLGVKVYNSSNVDLVSLGHNAPGGLAIRPTTSSNPVSLSKALFGRSSAVSQKLFSVVLAPNETKSISWSNANGTFPIAYHTAWTNNVLVRWRCQVTSTMIAQGSKASINVFAAFLMNGAIYYTKDYGGGGSVIGSSDFDTLGARAGTTSSSVELGGVFLMPVTPGVQSSYTMKVDVSSASFSTDTVWVDGINSVVTVDPIYDEVN